MQLATETFYSPEISAQQASHMSAAIYTLIEQCQADGVPIPPEKFCSAVNQALGNLEITAVDLARGVTASESAVSKWRRGTAAPRPMMRPVVLAWLAHQAESLAKSYVDGGEPNAEHAFQFGS